MLRLFKVIPLLMIGLLAACSDGESYDSESETSAATEVEMPASHNPGLTTDLEATRDALIMTVTDASADQWTFHESEDRWNMAEVIEHIIIAENMFYSMLTEQVFVAEAMPVTEDDMSEADAGIAMFIRDRSTTFEAPEPAQPKGVYATPAEAIEAFMDARNRTLEFVASTDLDLRAYSASIPGSDAPPMDGYQWFVFLSGHSARHTAQIVQITDDAGYPTD